MVHCNRNNIYIILNILQGWGVTFCDLLTYNRTMYIMYQYTQYIYDAAHRKRALCGRNVFKKMGENRQQKLKKENSKNFQLYFRAQLIALINCHFKD